MSIPQLPTFAKFIAAIARPIMINSPYTMKHRLAPFACILGFAGFVTALHAAPLRFNRDIRPILSENCFACHGPDGNSRKGNLRLDRGEEAIADGIITPGKAASSEFMKRILTANSDELMPPPESHKKLTGEQRDTLRRWIDQGARYEKHWAFIKPRRPAVPTTPASREWARNPIDHFILSGLIGSGLKTNPEADRHVLARRVALDVTGLPPSPDLLEDYLADQKSGNYERFVTKLLVSKHAGEHRTRFWLDAARYGDTHGMHLDNYREMWPYRDWVINAFNQNLPFDRFVIEQIAGDLLPKATLDQQIATGFSRCNVSTAEGGSIPEEIKVRYMVDRVETLGTVFLGLTTGCAVCHDHKYDPLTMKDFYSLGTFFNNTTQPAMDGNQKDSPPVVVLPDEEHAQEWKRLQTQRRRQRAALARHQADLEQDWKTRDKAVVHPVGDDHLVKHLTLTEGGADTPELPKEAKWEDRHPAGRRGLLFSTTGFTTDLPQLHTDEPMTVSFWVRTPDRLMTTRLIEHYAPVPDAKDPKKKKNAGWRINSSVQGALTFSIEDGRGGKIDCLLPGDEALTPRTWQHVAIRYSGGRSKTSLNILVNGNPGNPRPGSQAYIASVKLPPAKLHLAPSLPTGGLSDLRIFRRYLGTVEVELLAREFETKQLLASDKSWNELSDAEQQLAGRHIRNVIDRKNRNLLRRLAASEKRVDYIRSRSTTTLVMQEKKDSAPRGWILQRGEYDKRGEEVGPNVPGILSALPKKSPRNRLGLARWLVSPDHPLTARVFVNRLWQSVFGIGLVKTTEDFGIMGESPSHPDLLDWLALEFMESGWDVRHLVNLMVTSATYRQSGFIAPAAFAKDPDNRLLARGSRLRLDAEVIRDQALAVSGLLHPAVGGKSVRPYQPGGIWRVVAFSGSNTRQFKADTGNSLYRRSVYTFWKRTSPPPSMAAFDAPTREQCTVRRERTNTPLQALTLMNDPQFVEAARHFAQRALLHAPDDLTRIRWMYRTSLVSPSTKADEIELLAAVKDFRRVFGTAADDAKKLIETGDSKPAPNLAPQELAAWTMAANLLFNRDDFINKN
jgi:hypothetical protein